MLYATKKLRKKSAFSSSKQHRLTLFHQEYFSHFLALYKRGHFDDSLVTGICQLQQHKQHAALAAHQWSGFSTIRGEDCLASWRNFSD
jgi:hypothetical protein